MSIEEILNMLGNETRREILSLLSREPRYVSELSQILNVGQKAVIEHLELMRHAGMVDATYKKMEKGRPRKYYCIRKDMLIEVKIGQHLYDINAFTLGINPEVLEFSPNLEKIVKKFESILRSGGSFTELRGLLDEIENEKTKINEVKRVLEYLSSRIRYLLGKEIVAEEIMEEFYRFI